MPWYLHVAFCFPSWQLLIYIFSNGDQVKCLRQTVIICSFYIRTTSAMIWNWISVSLSGKPNIWKHENHHGVPLWSCWKTLSESQPSQLCTSNWAPHRFVAVWRTGVVLSPFTLIVHRQLRWVHPCKNIAALQRPLAELSLHYSGDSTGGSLPKEETAGVQPIATKSFPFYQTLPARPTFIPNSPNIHQ